MTTKNANSEHKKFSTPDEARKFELGQADILNIGGGAVGRLEFKPGWRWSKHVKPVAKTEWCEAPHFQYHLKGTLRVRMANGTEFDAVPGDVTALPSGHDAWVVGNEPVVVIDWFGASNYAK
jgi:quercetin dioxygenase-like cupin family protein